MTTLSRALPALLFMALAACRQPANDGDATIGNEVNAVAAANAGTEAAPPSEQSPSLAENNSSAELPTSIPALFQGRWGINRADCTSTRGDAKGLLTIEDARLIFYESRGALGDVLGATPTSFDARYGFTGEGQTWKRTERLSLVDGKLQRRTDAEPGQEPPVNLTYERCGA